MIYAIIRHKVRDFAQWKPVYDAHGAARKQAGCRNEQLFRISGDPNDLVILTEWDNLEDARKFAQSTDLRDKMLEGGVQGTPEIQYLEQIEKRATGEGLGKAA